LNKFVIFLKTFFLSKRAMNILRLVIFIGVIALTVYLYTIRDHIRQLQGYGYAGLFLVSIVANATIIIPLPGIVLTSAMGTIFNPLGVAIAAGSGAALGELTGYLAGFSGQGVIEKSDRYKRILEWMKKKPRLADLTILVLATIPNPFFDLAGMASGALRIPIWRFLLWVWIGKILKMLPFAYAGTPILKFLTTLLERLHFIK
jgi:membrane protein YqaA with SNARE-associated domain